MILWLTVGLLYPDMFINKVLTTLKPMYSPLLQQKQKSSNLSTMAAALLLVSLAAIVTAMTFGPITDELCS